MVDSLQGIPDPDAIETPMADHIIAFGRVLRRAGLDIGSAQIMDALRAVDVVGIERRADVYQALFGTFVLRRSDVEVFDQAFHLFWRAPSELAELLQMALPSTGSSEPDGPRRRIQEALQEKTDVPPPPPSEETDDREVEVTVSYTDREKLREKDFADFSAEEMARAKEMMRSMRWPIEPRAVRRRTPRSGGRALDIRGTIRRGLRRHGEFLDLQFRGPKTKPRPVVVLCDISGSMEAYSRMLLHFLHAITNGMRRVESFVFGTRLTRITRHLRQRDVDDALQEVSERVEDWSGGTRIGETLKEFNYEWLRRVLPSGGVVMIISDGCDRGDTDLLAHEMERLARNCHRLLWLNPLLRYDQYEPRTQGMQAALPHVDDFLPVHNLESLRQVGRTLTDLAHRPSRSWRRSFDV